MDIPRKTILSPDEVREQHTKALQGLSRSQRDAWGRDLRVRQRLADSPARPFTGGMAKLTYVQALAQICEEDARATGWRP